MTSERSRIKFLIARDGLGAARAWVERTLRIYQDALANRGSHAAAPEFRPLFEEAIQEYEEWLAAQERNP